jgi:hypothetical protein
MREGYREKESDLNKKVVDWLNTIDGCFAKKRQGGPGNAGQPDVTGCINGIRIELEGKIGDNKPTKLQLKWLRKWSKAGAITGVYWSLSDAQQIVKRGMVIK